ncbi:MAG: PcfB family protein [Lachnospiraceae bacterium]|nr:PcfB family protein [Lachnospiraceae bacterium]
MQEEVDEKTLALIISSTKLTASEFRQALGKLSQKLDEKNKVLKAEQLEARKTVKAKREGKREARKAVQPGKKTLNEMMREGAELTNIEITDNNIRSFEKIARKYGITYSLKKDRSSDPPRYLVFFRAKDVDVMEAAFKEYTGATLPLEKKRSIRKRLQKAIGISKTKHREREKVKEKSREPMR